jgi:hypothetical protein
MGRPTVLIAGAIQILTEITDSVNFGPSVLVFPKIEIDYDFPRQLGFLSSRTV